ncbi:WxcM-like domain-containing protein [Patescibacteria group bacterium]|nr:WxcM-like domain-containing protein [Patescibacteria group bacterium]MBU4099010.1 WxcM-like domain-containing protein [Patescibacteria group bacterium]
MTKIITQIAKKVTTFDADKKENGWLIELFKDKDTGTKTEVYLTAALPGAFKGYHLHRVRAARYLCLKGKMKITIYERDNDRWIGTEYILDAANPTRLFIPKNTATGLENIGIEEAWLINYPDPAYDPGLKDEQVEYTKEELESGVIK